LYKSAISILSAGFPLLASGWDECINQGLDLGGDPIGGKRFADSAALGGEVLRFGHLNASGDGFGMDSGSGEVTVQRLGVVVFGNRQSPQETVEVASISLPVRLKVSDLRENGSAIDQRQ